jgi:hypothetical protein
MPQFDKVTFFNQILWFLLAFLGFYFVILKGLLPILAASLKTRKKVINYIFLTGNSNSENSFKKSYFKNLQKFLKAYKILFSSFAQKKSSLFHAAKIKTIVRTVVSF